MAFPKNEPHWKHKRMIQICAGKALQRMVRQQDETDVLEITVLRVCDQLKQDQHDNHPKPVLQLLVCEQVKLLGYHDSLLSVPCLCRCRDPLI